MDVLHYGDGQERQRARDRFEMPMVKRNETGSLVLLIDGLACIGAHRLQADTSIVTLLLFGPLSFLLQSTGVDLSQSGGRKKPSERFFFEIPIHIVVSSDV